MMPHFLIGPERAQGESAVGEIEVQVAHSIEHSKNDAYPPPQYEANEIGLFPATPRGTVDEKQGSGDIRDLTVGKGIGADM